jgi:hypothetical protein
MAANGKLSSLFTFASLLPFASFPKFASQLWGIAPVLSFCTRFFTAISSKPCNNCKAKHQDSPKSWRKAMIISICSFRISTCHVEALVGPWQANLS